MLKEFKEFIAKGNVIDLAVAVVLGLAFTAIVTSFTNDILMQILAIFGGKPDFSDYTLEINDAVIYWGSFLTAVVNFLIIAFALFLIVKLINSLQNMRKTKEEENEETEIELLTQIRDSLASRGQ